MNQKDNFMNDLNFSRKPAARMRPGGLLALFLLAGLLTARAQPIMTQDLHVFGGGCTNACEPAAALTQGSDGNFYGTTYYTYTCVDAAGNIGYGTVFQMTTNGDLTTLAAFNNTNGAFPASALVQGLDGNFYGTTTGGGVYTNGTVFRISTNGMLTSLYSFTGTNDGATPSGLTLGSDGNFYGTTVSGGTNGWGTVFDINTNGMLTSLYSFTGTNDGAYPNGLVQGRDGNFYGTTVYGSRGYGTVFRVTTSGALTTLASFNFTNGFGSRAGLTFGPDGSLYGTTSGGGDEQASSGASGGTLFKVTTNGVLTMLFAFPVGAGNFWVGDPVTAMTLGPDGNLYGTTPQAIFQLMPNGTLTYLVSDGPTPDPMNYNSLTIGNDGNFYGTTGGNGDPGSVFRLNAVAPFVSQPQPASIVVPAGANVTITAGAFGAFPMSYQWMFGSNALAGATNDPLILADVRLSESGLYSVLVTNSDGSALSSNAVLVVLPAVAISQRAGGLSATGAVLNGSVSVASNQTIAWFEWGTDTNYGNIAGETVVPGDNGSNNISSNLSGLPGNIYHYRIDAANDFGIVYGDDQSFTVGFAPTVTTLGAANSTNGSTLNATVNPNGWDTKVYFKWGPSSSSPFGMTSSLTNSTPLMDVGGGATPLNVSSLLTGLAPYKGYAFDAVASNHLGQVSGATIYFASSPFTSAPLGLWNSVAASADGTKLMAISRGGSAGIYISTNSGAVWTLDTSGNGLNASVGAASADATKLIVLGGYGNTSTNSGANWTEQTNAPLEGWSSVASSADGMKLAAVSTYYGVFSSSNSGINWTHQTNGLLNGLLGVVFDSIASSADGVRLAAVSGNGAIYTSTNSGVNWIKSAIAPSASWSSLASSEDGTKLAAAATAGNVYLSTNAGANWSPTSLPTNNWKSVAESADGSKIVALANSESSIFGAGSGGIWTSTDFGNTWVSNNVPSASWACAAMSADGNEFIAVMGSPSSVGGIYVSQTTPCRS